MATRTRKIVIDDLMAGWLAGLGSDNTRAAYASDLRRFVAWCREQGVDPLGLDAGALRRFRAAEERTGASPATTARRLSAIASFGTYTTGRGVTDGFSDVRRPAVGPGSATEVLADREASALLAAADRHTARVSVLVRLLMLDGLKVGEAAAADAADVSGRPPTMDLTVGDRVVRLHPDTAVPIRTYLARRRTGPLLLSEGRARRSERLSRFGIDYLIKDVAREARVDRVVSGNTLRRRYVMAAHADGDPLEVIRRRAGHVDVRTTRRYLTAPDPGGPR
ncbi:MAG: tyrosine-type recombinase/integrase [Acidimicrobiia bacterium]